MNFTKPTSLNGTQLKAEFKAAGIDVDFIRDNADGTLTIEVPSNKSTVAETIVQNHVGVEVVPTIAEKLASVGLSIEDLKVALGV
jgi:hypothetical protein